MSFNRENVVWRSSTDQRWYRGFYRVAWVDPSPDADPEWDVEYGSDFEWVSGPYRTQEDAWNSWTGANPGGFQDGSGENTSDLDTLYIEAKNQGLHINNRGKWNAR